MMIQWNVYVVFLKYVLLHRDIPNIFLKNTFCCQVLKLEIKDSNTRVVFQELATLYCQVLRSGNPDKKGYKA